MIAIPAGPTKRIAMAQTPRPPIRTNALRQPGQSVRQQHNQLLVDKLLPIGITIFVLWFVAAVEWAWMSGGLRPHPLIWTAFATVITVYGVVRAWPLMSRLRYLALGYRGERAVGDFLDRLRILGYHVFHDVPAEGGNIDHVIVSTRGIYTIETRTRNNPSGRSAKIVFDGETVSLAGGPADPAPVIQARAQAARLQRTLRAVTGRRLEVRPMVVYPGWSVERTEEAASSDVLALSPKGLYRRIKREPETMPPDVVGRIARQLAAFIRKRK